MDSYSALEPQLRWRLFGEVYPTCLGRGNSSPCSVSVSAFLSVRCHDLFGSLLDQTEGSRRETKSYLLLLPKHSAGSGTQRVLNDTC